MSIAYWMVLGTAVLPYLLILLTATPSSTQASRWGTGYDNHRPREMSAKLEGWRQRAFFAQQNAYEAFPPFAVAVLMAGTLRGPSTSLDVCAGAFLGVRVLYSACYVLDWARARSTAWFGGIFCVLAVFAVAAGWL
jgi:uncharacterized MAPEG superfamily protein